MQEIPGQARDDRWKRQDGLGFGGNAIKKFEKVLPINYLTIATKEFEKVQPINKGF
jgi:hypothetical protein